MLGCRQGIAIHPQQPRHPRNILFTHDPIHVVPGLRFGVVNIDEIFGGQQLERAGILGRPAARRRSTTEKNMPKRAFSSVSSVDEQQRES